MNRINSVTKPLTWFMTLLLVALAAGCGGAGQSPILGGGGAGVILSAPPGAIIPGGICTVATGPTIPTVASTNPSNGNQSVSIGTGVKQITATFSLAMDPATINATTFKLAIVGGVALAPASVSYSALAATFTTAVPLLANTSYMAVITVGAKSATAVPLSCSYAWTFKTAAAAVPLAINLGAAATYGIAAGAGMTSTGVTVVNGNVALTPTGTCSDATGGPGGAAQSCMVEHYGAHTTGLTVNGSIRFPTDSDSGVTATSVANALNTAWKEGFNKVPTFASGYLVGQLAGKILIPGVYNEANLGLSAGGVATFDAQNDPNAIFIIQVGTIGGAGDFSDSGTLLLPSRIDLVNQAQARNVWFVVGRDITIGSGTNWNGNILAGRTATINDGSTVQGRVLAGAQTSGAITLTGFAAPSVTTITVP